MIEGNFFAVRAASKEDVYQDIARIPEYHRKDLAGKLIPEGVLCRFETKSGKAYLFVRGTSEETPVIILDDISRARLGVHPKDEVDFKITRATFLDEMRWSVNASHPAYRIASRIAVLSLILGVLGLALGILALFK